MILKDVCINKLVLCKNTLIFRFIFKGEIAGMGTFEELQADGTDFAALLKKQEEEEVMNDEPKSPLINRKNEVG